MPDAMDRVQQFADDHVDDSLKRHANRPRPAGRATCANLECADDIAPQRQALGAQVCLACQRAEEGASVHQRTWRGR